MGVKTFLKGHLPSRRMKQTTRRDTIYNECINLKYAVDDQLMYVRQYNSIVGLYTIGGWPSTKRDLHTYQDSSYGMDDHRPCTSMYHVLSLAHTISMCSCMVM